MTEQIVNSVWITEPPPPSVEQAGGGGVDHLLLTASELRLRLVLPLIGVGLVCVGWTWAACRSEALLARAAAAAARR